ncbi:MAG: hypothetical protein WCV99_06240 [Sterolibacterium sp.]|jgi:hypothetical protein
MANWYTAVTRGQADLLDSAFVFFVASADPNLLSGGNGEGPVNVSPRGGKLLLLSPNRIAFLDYHGSGNETQRHVAAGGPMTLMVCSFDETDAAIVRLYGNGNVIAMSECEYADRLQSLNPEQKGAPRQVIELAVERTMTSCGYGVPVMSFVQNRDASQRGRRFKE